MSVLLTLKIKAASYFTSKKKKMGLFWNFKNIAIQDKQAAEKPGNKGKVRFVGKSVIN